VAEIKNMLASSVANPERKMPLGKRKRRWKLIQMDVKKLDVKVCTRFIWFKTGSSEHSDGPSIS
jgi:hypothetical protein